MDSEKTIIVGNEEQREWLAQFLPNIKSAINDSNLAKLYSALAKAQADLKAVDKASRNEYHGYNYASAEDMMTAATAVMGEHGLAFVCVGSKFDKQAQAVTATYVLIHEGGGTMDLGSHELTVHPDKGRPMDKAISTALTYLQAYTLRSCFNIPRVPEGTERDSTDDKSIQAWKTEEQRERKAKEDASKKEHAKKTKTLGAKRKLMYESCEEFIKAAGAMRDKGTMSKFIAYTTGAEYPDGMEGQIEALDHVLQFIVEWGSCEPTEAQSMAHEFDIIINGKPDAKARDDAAFEASQA